MSDENTPTTPETPETPETPNEETPSGGALTPEAIQQLVSEIKSGVGGDIDDKLKTLADGMERLQPSGSGDDKTPTRSREDEAADLANRLLENPESTIEELFQKYANKHIAPVMGEDFASRRDHAIETVVKPFVDDQLGKGQFDERVRDRLMQSVQHLRPSQAANPDILLNATRGILGAALFDSEGGEELWEALQKQREARKAAAQQPPETLGAGGSRPHKPQLSPDAKDSIRRLRDAGVPISEEEILDAKERPATLSAWKEKDAKAKAKAS